MKKYKAVVIDFRKIIKWCGATFLSGMIAVSAVSHGYRRVIYNDNFSENIIRQNIGIADTSVSFRDRVFKCAETLKDWTFEVLLGYVPTDTESVLEDTISFLKAEEKEHSDGIILSKPKLTQDNLEATREWEASIPKENRAPIKSINAAQRSALAIGNETSYGIDLSAMLEKRPVFDLNGDGPKILITHTHATESYAPIGAEIYDITVGDRNEDKQKNVVAVGRRMKEIFESYGIETMHDEVLHDAPSFNGSYAHSLSSVEDYIEKYPSLQIVFDIHRDSIVYDDNTKAKTVAKINGKDAAQLMFVVGTDASGLEHPNWRENMKSAVWFQKVISETHPTLMRHINLRKERFNGHTTGASMIIEVGTSGNSLDEAIYGIELATDSLAKWMINSK